MNGSEFTLAGSVHAGKPELFPLPESYLNAYRQADIAIFELADGSEAVREMIFDYARKDSLKPEQCLDQYLSDECKEILASLFKGREEDLARYYHYKGWLLNMTVAGIRSVMSGYNPELSVDMYFHDLAVRDKKGIMGLENIETQLQLFEFDLPLEAQVKIVESAVRGAEQQAFAEKPLFDTYYDSNQEEFQKAFMTLMNLENPQMQRIYNQVFVKRNKAWVEKLIEISVNQPGKYFMLVGSGHYFGPDNVRELLQARGFTVSPFTEDQGI